VGPGLMDTKKPKPVPAHRADVFGAEERDVFYHKHEREMMSEKITVRIAGGGFHNSSDTILELPADRVLSVEKMEAYFAHPEWHSRPEALLDGDQLQRLGKHMCGIGGCTCCCGYMNAAGYDIDTLRGLGVEANESTLFAVCCEIEEHAHAHS
jgi:hypothetical protein